MAAIRGEGDELFVIHFLVKESNITPKAMGASCLGCQLRPADGVIKTQEIAKSVRVI